jgi:HEAT repeat protein
MKRKRLHLFFAAIVVVAAILVCFPYPCQLVFGPKYNGVPLCAWQTDFRARWLAIPGPETFFTRLLDWLRQGQTMLDWSTLSNQDMEAIFITLADDPDPVVRKEVVSQLRQLPGLENSPAAVKVLIGFLDDPDSTVFEEACRLDDYLMDDPAFDAAFLKLASFLDHREPERRRLALEVVGRPSWRHGREALEMVVRRLDDPDPSVRAYALGYMAGCRQTRRIAKTATPKILSHLKDDDALCRVEAARATWRFTKRPDDALPVLRQELRNSDSNVRLKAITGLRELGKHCLPAWDEIVERATKDDNSEVKRFAMGPLKFGGKKATPVLLALLDDSEDRVRNSALYCLADIGPEAIDAVPTLLSRVHDLGDYVFPTLAALKDPAVVPHLLELLEQQPQATKIEIIRTLGRFGADAKIAETKLLEFLSDKDKVTRGTAASALARIGLPSKQVLGVLLELFDESDVQVSISAWEGFYYHGPFASEAVLKLKAQLQSGDKSKRKTTIFLLSSIGADASMLIPDLLGLLNESKYSVIRALGEIHQRADLVVPALLPQLQDKYYGIRLCTVQALAKFGPDAKDAIPALTELIEDDDDEVSDAAVEALAVIAPKGIAEKGNTK